MINNVFMSVAVKEKELNLKKMKQEKKRRHSQSFAILGRNSLEYQTDSDYECLKVEDLGTLLCFYGQMPNMDK
jgi:hypothetical protein